MIATGSPQPAPAAPMPIASPKPWLSLDTGIAVRLGEDLEAVHLFRELAQEREFTLCLVPTALAELEHQAQHAKGALRAAARRLLEQREAWGIECALLADADAQTAAEQLAARLRAKGYIPQIERRDSLILSETSVAEIPILVAADIHYHTDNAALALSLANLGASPVAVYHPTELARAWLRS